MINLKETLDGVTDNLLRGRLAILATILASRGCDLNKQRELLDPVVDALQNAEFREQLVTSSGRPIPVDIENVGGKTIFVFNESLLNSITSLSIEMLSEQLAAPIAKLLDLPTATITIVFHDKGEEQIRDLSFKLLGQIDQEVITNTSLPTVQRFLVKKFLRRLREIISLITNKSDFSEIDFKNNGLDDLLLKIGKSSRWPLLSDVKLKEDELNKLKQQKTPPAPPPLPFEKNSENEKTKLTQNSSEQTSSENKISDSDNSEDSTKIVYGTFLDNVIKKLDDTLIGSEWEGHGIDIANIIWNSADLNAFSVLLDAGRELRSRGLQSTDIILKSIAESLAGSLPDFSLRLKDWPRFTELNAAIEKLIHEEGLLFGSSSLGKPCSKPISVVEKASIALGNVLPVDLPFDLPLVCWTPREIDALRDAYLGKYKGMLGTQARASAYRTHDYSWFEKSVPPLTIDFDLIAPAIKIIPIGSTEVPAVVDAHNAGEIFQGDDSLSLVERAWFANFKQLRYQFAGVPDSLALPLLEDMIAVYDAIDPDMQELWTRRLKNRIEMQAHPARAFAILAKELAELTGKPILLDPFENLETSSRLEIPRFVVVAPVVTTCRIAVAWIPLRLLSATKLIGPITVRLIEDLPSSGNQPEKIVARYDIALHIDQLTGQPTDVLFQSIYGDSIQLVLML